MSQPDLPLEHVTALNCPRCGQRMVQRTNRDTDEPFLGCSAWPRLRPQPGPARGHGARLAGGGPAAGILRRR